MKKILRLCLYLAVVILLPACSSMQPGEHDGPPPGNVDVSKIPDAVPEAEPLSKYGNSSYVVYGRRYYVLKSSKGYDERGIASWYGMMFHRHRTSDGETYNLYGMTAASRTLPIPCYAQVTNLENGRKVIVKVNDRGPFKANRIMDLSYVAAKKLDMLGRGTAYVEVKAIDPGTWGRDQAVYAQSTPQLKRPGHPILYLQVGAFSTRENADRLSQRVAGLVHESVRVKKVYAKGRSSYKVQIGPLGSVTVADEVSHKIARSGIGRPMTVIE